MEHDNWVLNDVEEIKVQLFNRIQSGIFSGMIKENEEIPQIDELANTLGISKEHVENAYIDLCNHGILQFLQSEAKYKVVDKRKVYEVRNYTISTLCFTFIYTLSNYGVCKSEFVTIINKYIQKMISDWFNKHKHNLISPSDVRKQKQDVKYYLIYYLIEMILDQSLLQLILLLIVGKKSF